MRLSPLLFALLAAGPLLAAGEGHDHADHDDDHAHAHEHGTAVLEVEVDGFLLSAKVTLPGGDIFHDVPEAEQSVARAQEILPAIAALIAVPPAAGCTLATATASVSEIEEEGEHEGHHDYTIGYSMICDAPEAMDRLTVTLFDALPELEAVDLHLHGQGFAIEAELDHDRATVTLDPFLAAES